MPVARTPVTIRAPSSRAPAAKACVAPCGSRKPSPGIHTAPKRSRRSPPASAPRPRPPRRALLPSRSREPWRRRARAPSAAAGLEAKRRLPTVSNTPSSRYRSIEYRRNRIIVGEGLKVVTRPAACAVDPLVSSPLSSSSTSLHPAFARWYATLHPVTPPPITTARARRSSILRTRWGGVRARPSRGSDQPYSGGISANAYSTLMPSLLRGSHDEVDDQREYPSPDHDHVGERAVGEGEPEVLHEQEARHHEPAEQEAENTDDRNGGDAPDVVDGARRGLVASLPGTGAGPQPARTAP